MRLMLLGTVMLLLMSPLAMGQDVPPLASPSGAHPACEAQVQEQYRSLTTDKLVTEMTAPQWGPQLAAIASQLRVTANKYELAKNRSDLYEQNWLATNEQLRQASQRLQTLQAEVERLKAPAAPAN